MSPSVAIGAEMRRAGTTVGAQVVGTSAIFMRSSVALMTISEANSMPVVWRSMRGERIAGVGAKAAMKILCRGMEKEAADHGEDGLPM